MLLPPPSHPDAVGADDLTLYTTTVYLEGESEPDDGKLAIAWTIRNRMDAQKRTARQVILGVEGLVDGDGRAYEAFSCWNDDYSYQRALRLADPNPALWDACWRAAAAAYWRLLPDPTKGGTFYLNPVLTRKIRPRRDLPSWYDPARVTFRSGQHEFLT